jgi:protein-tyrosine phosphatase
MHRVCFVCLGNICRSPQAEGIFRKLVHDAGLDAQFHIGSAGTGAWHVGEPADPRTRATSARRGVPLNHRAQQFRAEHFADFDHILAMDRHNLANLLAMAPDEAARRKVRLLRDLDPAGTGDVPDPYNDGEHGFDHVFNLCEAACQGLLAELTAK